MLHLDRRAALFSLFAATFAACSAERDRIVPVTGVVEYKGAPLANVSVTFTPETGRSANGVTREDGTFELTTYESGDGAIAGSHVVTITALGEAVPEEIPENYSYTQQGKEAASRVPRHYAESALSGLKAIVKTDGENRFKFELTDEAPIGANDEPPPY